ncbi:GNAT family N-acetyltransferase [Kitasatospora sp. NPDC096147]|uniref:GNAT family N-acetyltransferase n=1 Tax=Kitasatospora sp. NPDC096147 TaxID=3364093 RepID=UPI003826DD7B
METPETPRRVIRVDAELTLRAYQPADLPELRKVVEESLDHLVPWMPWASDDTPERTAEFVDSRAEKWENGTDYTYAIVLDGAIAGSTGLFRREGDPAERREIGYWLHPAATGRGVVSRAARALTVEAFRLPEVAYVEIVHDDANRASGAVPARLGFTDLGTVPSEKLAPADTGADRHWRLTRDQLPTLTGTSPQG